MSQILAKGDISDIKKKIEELLEKESNPKAISRYKELLHQIAKWERKFKNKKRPHFLPKRDDDEEDDTIDISKCEDCQYFLIRSLDKIMEIEIVGPSECITCDDANYLAWAVSDQFPKTAEKYYQDIKQTRRIIDGQDRLNKVLLDEKDKNDDKG